MHVGTTDANIQSQLEYFLSGKFFTLSVFLYRSGHSVDFWFKTEYLLKVYQWIKLLRTGKKEEQVYIACHKYTSDKENYEILKYINIMVIFLEIWKHIK